MKAEETVAVVRLDGAISTDGGGQGNANVRSFTKAIHAASMDPKVKAIVVRINSPGGDAVASDAMHAACLAAKKAREGGIPIIASMGKVAASGGYFVAVGCDKILAAPTTVTGSIGVIGVQFNAAKLLEKVGLSVDFVSKGHNAEWHAGAHIVKDLPEEIERKILKRIELIYLDFLEKVATGRGESLTMPSTPGQLDAFPPGSQRFPLP